jgi:hypothetical protein
MTLPGSADPIAGLHGFYAGAMRHQLLGIPKCRPCKKAAADYQREWRKRGKCAPGLGWPLLDREVTGG